MNKKAQTFNIFTFIIVAFLAVVLLGSLVWMMGLINNVMHDVGVANDVNAGSDMYVNMTEASDNTFGKLNTSIQALRMVAIVYILGFAVIIIITNALVSKHPLWFIAYIFIGLLAVLFAPMVSNAYESLLKAGIMDGTLSTFQGANFLVLNLPAIVLVMATLGGIFLFINIIRPQGGVEAL